MGQMEEQAGSALIPRGLGKRELPSAVPFRGRAAVYSSYLMHAKSTVLHTARYAEFFHSSFNEQVAGSKIKAQK